MDHKKTTMLLEPETRSAPIRLNTIEDLQERMNEIHDQIARRAFEIFEENGRESGQDFDHWLRAEGELLLPVRLVLEETEEQLKVTAEVPGLTEEELRVALEPRRLTITAKSAKIQEKEQENFGRRERLGKELLQVADLPAEVDATRAKASLQNGALEITLPKAVSSKPAGLQAVAG